MQILFQSCITSSFFLPFFKATPFFLSYGPLGGLLQQISKRMGLAGLVLCVFWCQSSSSEYPKIFCKLDPCRNLLRTNTMCTLSVFFWCWQILPSHMILTQIFPRCVRLHQPCGIYPVSQTAEKQKAIC